MKQHITKKQWNELSVEEKINFLNSFENLDVKLNKPEEEIKEDDIFEMEAPTIGQLIEYLGDDLDLIEFNHCWFVGLMSLDMSIPAKELIDSLWEATKYKLKI